ncbi:MAG: tetratricopeptide repeat protein, partial [Bacteroidota bacterium]
LSHLYAGEVEPAQHALKQSHIHDPADWEPIFYLGTLAMEEHQFDMALEHFRVAKQKSGLQPELLAALLELYDYLGDFEAMIEVCNQIIQERKLFEDESNLVFMAYWSRVDAYLSLQLFNQALREFEKIVEDFSELIEPASLCNNLGYVHSLLENWKEAQSYLERAVAESMYFAFAWSNLGFVHFKQGQVELGMKYIQKAIRMDPENAYAYKSRALVYLGMNEREKAEKDLLKAKNLGYGPLYGAEVDELLAEYFAG